jgi:hypothetical protein
LLPDIENSFAAEEALLLRVLQSQSFRRSARLSHFLSFVCAETFAQRSGAISEHAIGVAVFGRPSDYNPGDDNIVRVSAREVRARLEQYFQNEGQAEPVLLQIPKGSYVPTFQPRELARPVPAATATAQPVAEAAPAPHAPALTRRSLLAAVAGLSVGAGSTWWLTRPHAPAPLWKLLFDDKSTVLVVVADSAFSFIQELTNRDYTVSEYARRTFFEQLETEVRSGRLSPGVARLGRRQYTSFSDALLVGNILQTHAEFASRTRVRFARHLDQRELRSSNAVILGSPKSNPWAMLFNKKLNFQFVESVGHAPFIRNLKPRTGELTEYHQSINDRVEGLAVVALVPSLSSTGHVLLIGGTSMEATEAAGEWALRPAGIEACMRQLAAPASVVLPFEALLRIPSVDGSPQAIELIAARRVSA